MTPERLHRFIAGLPKAELHVHDIGSASPGLIARLAAKRAGSTPVPDDPPRVREYFKFRDFAHFINVYASVADLFRDAEDVSDLIYDVGVSLAGQQVRYAEVTLTPYPAIKKGIPARQYCEAIEDARRRLARDYGTQLRWCFDIPGKSGRAADVTLDVALRQRPDGLVSFGLGGPETEPIANFTRHFQAARASGLRSVPHAGESAGPERIWDAIRCLRVERIGHGIASVHDVKLLDHLRERHIPLEVCPTSNVNTRSVQSQAVHPLPALIDAGVPVTINSDDPQMFSTTLNEEYAIAAHLLRIDERGVAELARQAVKHAFVSDADKARIIMEIDIYLARWQKMVLTAAGSPAT